MDLETFFFISNLWNLFLFLHESNRLWKPSDDIQWKMFSETNNNNNKKKQQWKIITKYKSAVVMSCFVLCKCTKSFSKSDDERIGDVSTTPTTKQKTKRKKLKTKRESHIPSWRLIIIRNNAGLKFTSILLCLSFWLFICDISSTGCLKHYEFIQRRKRQRSCQNLKCVVVIFFFCCFFFFFYILSYKFAVWGKLKSILTFTFLQTINKTNSRYFICRLLLCLCSFFRG